MERVSVIIPVHNQPTTVGRAIESAIGQTYPELEVIVIDDGSTDSTADALSKHKSLTTIVTLPERVGPYKARFAGIARSHGEWITFIDADDYIDRNAIARCIDTAHRLNADIVQMRIKRMSQRWRIPLPTRQKYQAGKALDAVSFDDRIFPVQCWGKLYRASTIKGLERTAIGYDGLWGEDRLFNLSVFSKSPSIAVSGDATYTYNWGGCTSLSADRLEEFATVMSLKSQYLSEQGMLSSSIKETMAEEMLRLVRYNTRQMINSGHTEADIAASMRSAIPAEWMTAANISPHEIYLTEKMSLKRVIKHFIHNAL